MAHEDDEDDTFERVSDLAERLGLKGKDRDRYIHNHMEDMGYARVTSKESYQKKRDDDDDKEGRNDRYLSRRRSSSGGGNRRSGDDWE
jgi:hypothetical protein